MGIVLRRTVTVWPDVVDLRRFAHVFGPPDPPPDCPEMISVLTHVKEIQHLPSNVAPHRSRRGLRTRHIRSLLYPCFKSALCHGVVSGCFVHGVSPSSRFRPELAPKRGPAAPELAFRTPESASKVHAKLLGRMRPCGVGVCSSDFERSAGMALNRHTRAALRSRFRRNAAELDAGSSKFAMVNLGVKLKFHFVRKFFRP